MLGSVRFSVAKMCADDYLLRAINFHVMASYHRYEITGWLVAVLLLSFASALRCELTGSSAAAGSGGA